MSRLVWDDYVVLDLSLKTKYSDISERTRKWIEEMTLRYAEPVTALERFALLASGPTIKWKGGTYDRITS